MSDERPTPDHCDTCRWLNDAATMQAADAVFEAFLRALATDDDEALQGFVLVQGPGGAPGLTVQAADLRAAMGLSADQCEDIAGVFPLGDTKRLFGCQGDVTFARVLTIGTSLEITAGTGHEFALTAVWQEGKWRVPIHVSFAMGPESTPPH